MNRTFRLLPILFSVFMLMLSMDTLLAGETVKILFIHHSTGNNVIKGAVGIEAMFKKYNREHGTDYRFYEIWEPSGASGKGNYPYDYLFHTFTPERLKNFAVQFDLIIWKHCYPGSDVLENRDLTNINSARKSLENYKVQYRELRRRLAEYPATKFMVWTLPPRHRLVNQPEHAAPNAVRASEFAEWVKTKYLLEAGKISNQYVWDIRLLLTGPDHFLKKEYERSPDSPDSHPNQLANDTICPLFFQAILDMIEGRENELLICGAAR